MAFNAGGAMGGAASGAQMGSMVMPGIGTAVGAVAGGLFGGLMGGKKPKKRNLTEEMYENVMAQQNVAPHTMAAESAWRPEMIDINLRGLNQGIVKGLPIAQRAVEGASDIAGQAGMNALNQFGGQFADAQRSMNPELYGQLSDSRGMFGDLRNQYQQGQQTSPLMEKLQAFASQREIGQLSGQENRLAQQGAREAFGARGMGLSNPSIAGEILNRDKYRQQREASDIGMISGVEGMRNQQQQQNQQFGLGVGQYGLGVGNLGLGAMIRPEQVPGFAQSQQFTPGAMMGMAQGMNSRVIDPVSPYGQGVATGNQQMGMDQYAANQSNMAGFAQGMGSLAQSGAFKGLGGQLKGIGGGIANLFGGPSDNLASNPYVRSPLSGPGY